MKWIDVKEIKPPFETSVLVYCEIYGMYIGYYRRILDTSHGQWDDGKNIGVLPPLFWMYLPTKPPKTK